MNTASELGTRTQRAERDMSAVRGERGSSDVELGDSGAPRWMAGRGLAAAVRG